MPVWVRPTLSSSAVCVKATSMTRDATTTAVNDRRSEPPGGRRPSAGHRNDRPEHREHGETKGDPTRHLVPAGQRYAAPCRLGPGPTDEPPAHDHEHGADGDRHRRRLPGRAHGPDEEREEREHRRDPDRHEAGLDRPGLGQPARGSVQAPPSQYRSVPGAVWSGYQPGGVVVVTIESPALGMSMVRTIDIRGDCFSAPSSGPGGRRVGRRTIRPSRAERVPTTPMGRSRTDLVHLPDRPQWARSSAMVAAASSGVGPGVSTRSGSTGASYGSSIPVKPLISPARAFA